MDCCINLSNCYSSTYFANLVFEASMHQRKHNVTADEVLSTSKTSHSWVTALLNPVVPVFMMEGTPEPDREKSALNTTPTSTPRQPRLVSSGQPTSRQHLTLDQRVRRRVRRFSLMSDASENSLNSRISVRSKDKLKTKRDYKPKALTEIGKHQLDPMKKQCTVCYVGDFLNTDEADDLLDELKSEFF